MQNTNAKAKTTSAAFGYGSQELDGFKVYTIRLRTKRKGLLDLSLMHSVHMGVLNDVSVRKYMTARGRMYTAYVHVTTDHAKHMDVRKYMDLARALVHDVQATRLVIGEYEWMPQCLLEVLDREREMRGPVYKEAFGNDDLPF